MQVEYRDVDPCIPNKGGTRKKTLLDVFLDFER